MIVILISAYNEACALERLLPALPASLHGRDVHPIVISDGSTDETAAVTRAFGVEVFELWPNQGKSAALRAGLENIRARSFECLVLMDADGQHDPVDLPQLTGPVLAGGMDVVCGSRYLGRTGNTGRVPINRYLVRRGIVGVLQRQLGRRVTDPFCGYRCLSQKVALKWTPSGDRYEAELEMLFDAVRHGWAMCEVAVARIYSGDCSKMSATGGPLVGRLRVLWQYATTIARKSQELPSRTPQPAGAPAEPEGTDHGRSPGGVARGVS